MIFVVIFAAVCAVLMFIYNVRSAGNNALSSTVWVNAAAVLLGIAGYVFSFIYTYTEIDTITSDGEGITEIFEKVGIWIPAAVIILEVLLIISSLLSPGTYKLRHTLGLSAVILWLLICSMIVLTITDRKYSGDVRDGVVMMIFSLCAMHCLHPLVELTMCRNKAGYSEKIASRKTEKDKKREAGREAKKKRADLIGK